MLRSGLNIGKYFGIPVTIHWSWLFIFAIFTFSMADQAQAQGLVAGAYAIGAVTAILAFISLLAHEYGHALTARAFGIGTERITLFLLGGVAQIKESPRTPVAEFLIAIAGPAVSLGCMLIAGGLWFAGVHWGAPNAVMFVLEYISFINLAFAVFNMLPGFPMDGGRVLRAGLWWMMNDFLGATRIASFFGRGVGVLFVGFGIVSLFLGAPNIMFIFLGYFIYRLAGAEYRRAKVDSAFSNVYVRDFIRPVQIVVPANLPISEVVRSYLYQSSSERFPVIDGNTLLGYVSARDIAGLDRDRWNGVTAGRLAKAYRSSEILTPNVGALEAMQTMAKLGQRSLPVFSGTQLIGFFFHQDIMHYLEGCARRRAA